MNTHFWQKDITRQEIITKTLIPNNRNFNIYAHYYNFMDAKGVGLSLSFDIIIEVEKLFRKGIFEFIVIENNVERELYILPNKYIDNYAANIAAKINYCESEDAVLQLLLGEMY
jgi:hypothetical protein